MAPTTKVTLKTRIDMEKACTKLMALFMRVNGLMIRSMGRVMKCSQMVVSMRAHIRGIRSRERVGWSKRMELCMKGSFSTTRSAVRGVLLTVMGVVMWAVELMIRRMDRVALNSLMDGNT